MSPAAVAPRLDGPYPIGEKDLDNQVSYIAARPSTIGALLEIASRVKSGQLEVTSLVRHSEYQQALRRTNSNAATSLPMHTMGMAFDIALVNSPLETVYEIRDVLRAMRTEGTILFIGERKQLVFHVVPHPSRLGHFTEVYAQAPGAPPASGSAPVVAFSPVPGKARAPGVPTVTAEVIALVPSNDLADEWWAADHGHSDLVVDVAAAAGVEPTHSESDAIAAAASPAVAFLGIVAVMGFFGQMIRRRPMLARLFHPAEQSRSSRDAFTA